ncbi:MAG TPA: hypothetical protein VGD60_06970 [Candidatus Acidoferrales bacterium]
MSYREKTAWLSLIAIVVTLGPYFAIVGSRPAETLPNLRELGLFAVAMIVQMVIQIVGQLYLRHESPEDARTPPDERDRAIMGRSIRSAYYVLISGMILVGCVMPFNSSGWKIINAALLMIVTAEVVHYGVVVVSYRRQS